MPPGSFRVPFSSCSQAAITMLQLSSPLSHLGPLVLISLCVLPFPLQTNMLSFWFPSLSSYSLDCLTQSRAPSVEKWIKMRRHRTLRRNSWNAVSAMRLFILAASR